MNGPVTAQAPAAVVLIRPHRFAPNPATSLDNAFQSEDPTRDTETIAADAHAEVTGLAATLREHGVTVHLFEDEDGRRPDSVFPNNWFSTHAGGRIAIYPMFSPSRRTERRADVVETLKLAYRVQDVVDWSGLEYDGVFLEGTGAMVLDHLDRVAYVARSHRADPLALQRFCATLGYEPFVFDAADERGVPVYHTNVLMGIGTEVALVGLDLVRVPQQRAALVERLEASGREIVALSEDQVREFAGNAIELRGSAGRILVMSARAARSLTPAQRATLERSCPLVTVDLPTIELAGGSVRCMIAGVHLSARPGAGAPAAALPGAAAAGGTVLEAAGT